MVNERGWPSYLDGRPAATLRMDAVDQGVVLRHGDGPGRCDVYGAREAIVFEHEGTYYLNYDGAGDTGWLVSLATSPDGVNWAKHGIVLDLGPPGSDDSGTASYGVPYREGDVWHMFYIGTPNTSPAPDLIPAFPYLTMKAKAPSPAGPWTKQYDVVPFRPAPNAYYSLTASSGEVVRSDDEYLQFFSASTDSGGVRRTLGIARTRDLDGPWTVDPEPLVPLEEQIENASVYYEPENQTWFLFTNHVAHLAAGEYTDAIWVYWTKDLNHWDMDDKAVVLDRNNCTWSKRIVGAPWVQPIGDRLGIYYDGVAGTSTSHMGRDLGVAWLDLPLRAPRREQGLPNIALSATASASTTYPGYDPANAIDGSPNTGVTDSHGWANAHLAAAPHWLELDFGQPRMFARVDLYTTSGYELRDYRLQIWTGSGWDDIIDPVTGNTTVYRSHRFQPVTSSRLRVLCSYGSVRQPGFVRINEIEVYAAAGLGEDC